MSIEPYLLERAIDYAKDRDNVIEDLELEIQDLSAANIGKGVRIRELETKLQAVEGVLHPPACCEPTSKPLGANQRYSTGRPNCIGSEPKVDCFHGGGR